MKHVYDLIIFHSRHAGVDRVKHIQFTLNSDFEDMNSSNVADHVRAQTDKSREVLVMQDGAINRHLTRITNAGLNRLQNLSDDNWLSFAAGIALMRDITAHDFREHARRMWPSSQRAQNHLRTLKRG
jgi:hypothetical protein